MPLPLPNLDTRRWADLVEEGRALVPRYAPRWTDHNVHDPGITLIELFAWLVEADVYRANHISRKCRRKFLKLIGVSPRPPEPSLAFLSFTVKPGVSPQLLPARMTFRASVGALQVPFRTLADLAIVDSEIVAVQTTDGTTFTDQTRVEQGRFGFSAWGAKPPRSLPKDPTQQPALYIGFSNPLPVKTAVTLRCWFAGPRSDEAERQRLLDEMEDVELSCVSSLGSRVCPPFVTDDPWCADVDKKSGTRRATVQRPKSP